MGTQDRARNTRIEAWLSSGGTVLAATERAARSLVSAYHSARLQQGRTAWLTAAIFPWESWTRDRWLEGNIAGRMLLNPLQEQALWAQVIGKSLAREGLL